MNQNGPQTTSTIVHSGVQRTLKDLCCVVGNSVHLEKVSSFQWLMVCLVGIKMQG